MTIFPPDVKEAADKITSNWLKGANFDGEGMVLKVTKPLEKVKSLYGAEEDDYLVKNEILAVGESFRYTFEDKEGIERKIDTCSTPFFIAFKQCEELGVGDWVTITRTGKTDKTRYTVEKTGEHDEPAVAPEDELKPEDIGF